MNSTKILLLVFALFSFANCQKAQKINEETEVSAAPEVKTDLNALEFSEALKQHPDAVILDVRTPREFAASHLANAVNIDIYGNFDEEISKLDHSKPVMVYCLSGARSSSAIRVLKNKGFSNVFHLDGGLMSWRNENLPETNSAVASVKGMSKTDFDKITNSEKMVLVDFYADWCAPCKKMEPYLKEISADMKDKVKVVRIDADAHSGLCKELKIGAIPVLHLYRNGNLVWENTGFVPKETVVQKINQQ